MLRSKITVVFMALSLTTVSAVSAQRLGLREIMTLDSEQMERLVNKQLSVNEKEDEIFYSQAAQVLAHTALLHPRFSEREAAISRIKSKMDQDEYYIVVRRAAEILLSEIESSQKGETIDGRLQAAALVALTHWVIEARNLPQEEVGAELQKIASAEIEISDEAIAYGREPVKELNSPSEEAKVALAKTRPSS